MKRFRNILRHGLAVVSLPLCVGALTLWVRSYKAPIYWGISAAHGRRSFLLQRGQLTFFVSPAMSRAVDARTSELASQMRNDDIEMVRVYPPELPQTGRPTLPVTISPRFRLGSPTFEFDVAGSTRDRRLMQPMFPLAAASDDPDRYQAAHLLLTRFQHSTSDSVSFSPPGAPLSHGATRWNIRGVNGLHVSLTPAQSGTKQVTLLNPPSIDPAQRLAIRDRWHQTLDTRSRPFPFWPATAVTMILPAAWLAWIRRRWQKHRRHTSNNAALPAAMISVRHRPNAPNAGRSRPATRRGQHETPATNSVERAGDCVGTSVVSGRPSCGNRATGIALAWQKTGQVLYRSRLARRLAEAGKWLIRDDRVPWERCYTASDAATRSVLPARITGAQRRNS